MCLRRFHHVNERGDENVALNSVGVVKTERVGEGCQCSSRYSTAASPRGCSIVPGRDKIMDF